MDTSCSKDNTIGNNDTAPEFILDPLSVTAAIHLAVPSYTPKLLVYTTGQITNLQAFHTKLLHNLLPI